MENNKTNKEMLCVDEKEPYTKPDKLGGGLGGCHTNSET